MMKKSLHEGVGNVFNLFSTPAGVIAVGRPKRKLKRVI